MHGLWMHFNCRFPDVTGFSVQRDAGYAGELPAIRENYLCALGKVCAAGARLRARHDRGYCQLLGVMHSHHLFALTALDLCVNLVSARIQQFDGLIFQLPHITVQPQIGLISVDAFAGDQLRGFDSYR